MKKEYLIVFILFAFLSLGNITNLCRIYLPLTYDNQIFLAWEHAASTGLFPYKDIFYPYGLLSYYKSQNLIFAIIYLLLTPALFTFFYIVINKLFKDRLFSYFSIFVLYFFVIKLVSFELFTRYGLLAAQACIFALIFYSYKKTIPRRLLFVAGALNGLVLPFYNDIGLYSYAIFVGFLIIDKVLRRSIKVSFKSIQYFLVEILIFTSGLLVASIPFILYLLQNNAFSQFLSAMIELSDLVQFAKTPFIHSFVTKDNIFAFLILFSTITYLSYNLLWLQSRTSLTNYLQIALVFVLIVIEQKNIIRSIDNELILVALLLFILLFAELRAVLHKRNISRFTLFSFYVICYGILFFVGFHPFAWTEKTYSCWDKNISKSIPYLATYVSVKKELDKMPGNNKQIFSFPGDTIFYVLFNQKMPYYPTIYEASSFNAQQKQVQYIEDNHIDYIIYNYKNLAIQDEVPNYIRASILYPYILNNYTINKKINNFLILQKNTQQADFFKNRMLNDIPELKNYLLNINLEDMPQSEGFYKSNYLSEKPILSTNSLSNMNAYLKDKKVDSQNTFIVFEFKNNSKRQKTTITIKSTDNFETKVRFDQCNANKSCIIHLSRLPLFYKNRQVDSLSIDNTSLIQTISIYKSSNTNFW